MYPLELRHPRFHGMSDTRIYRTWADMIQRCHNRNKAGYKNYGARGISVCTEWQTFAGFYAWAMQSGYDDSLTIDRIDVNGHYTPENCRWATREMQDNNKRTNVFVEIHGQKLTLSQAARKYDVTFKQMRHRYMVGERGEKLLEPGKKGSKRTGPRNSPLKKLTATGIAEVKWLARHTDLFQSEIAERYGVSQNLVSKIKRGEIHGGIPEKKPARGERYENIL